MGNWKTLLGSTSGSEIAETAAVLPVLFTVLLAIFFFGRAYNIYGTITQAAQQGVRAAVVSNCATCGNTPLTAGQIATNVVSPVLQASKVDPTLVQPLTPSPAPLVCGTATAATCDPAGISATPSICVQQNITLTNSGGVQQCGTSVSFKYPYGFNLPFQSFTLSMKASAQMQGEQ